MTKLLSNLGLAFTVATVTMLAGCDLYFGGHNGNGSGSGDQPPGYSCGSDSNCAAGCYCANGTCTEGGFCTTDADCGPGFHCDTNRSSCVPNPTCGSDGDCQQGQQCNNGTCTSTCTCTSDADAIKKGFGWCDEARMTCMTGSDPNGACLGTVTCTTAPPRCAEHQVALILNGCYTGQCRDITACEGAPACGSLTHEDDCLGRATDCSASYNGLNCHKPDGTACHSGDTNCTCASYVFAGCVQKGAAHVDQFGNYIDGVSTLSATYSN